MEQRIMDVLRRMQPILGDEELRELKNVLHIVFAGCDVAQNTEIQCVDDSWRIDLEDYLMSKALEGKSTDTVNRYRYELTRLLSYINKAVADITDGDISRYMRAYKSIREVQNSTLKGVRAVYSSFFVWLRDHDKIRKNPMVLVESIKVEKRVKRPFTDTEREQLLRSCATIRDKANLSKVNVDVEVDCSALVRVCCLYAGIQVGDFNTASELETLRKTGAFEILKDDKRCKESTYLKRGDILVTRTKGHTVVVLNNGSGVTSASKSTGAYVVGQVYTTQVDDLSVRTGPGTNNTEKSYAELSSNAQQHAHDNGRLKKGTRVTCKDVRKNGSDIWIKIPSGWIAAYYGGKKYVG